jgi:sterol desaturase/sphingolipid hydroxylase (fatty acid hydroxylase superfamily)
MLDFLSAIFDTVIWDWNLRIFPLYMVAFVALAWLLFKFKVKQDTGFFKWLFPRKIYLHPSQLVDLKLFLVGRVLSLLLVFSSVAGTTTVAIATIYALTSLTGTPFVPDGMSVGQGIVATILIIVAADFSVYWIHRMHHEIDFLWPFHSVHHSAEVMSPITVYRKHPVYDLISTLLKSLLIGMVQGILLVFIFDGASVITVGTANIMYFIFNMVGANFRHSHIWLDYGKVLDHLLISPAQHQIHHSYAARHLNTNYGEVFAVWDRMFGTLYVPQKEESLEFGIVGDDGKLVPQPHGSLRDALLEPFVSSRKALKVRAEKNSDGAGEKEDTV